MWAEAHTKLIIMKGPVKLLFCAYVTTILAFPAFAELATVIPKSSISLVPMFAQAPAEAM